MRRLSISRRSAHLTTRVGGPAPPSEGTYWPPFFETLDVPSSESSQRPRKRCFATAAPGGAGSAKWQRDLRSASYHSARLHDTPLIEPSPPAEAGARRRSASGT